MSPSMVSDSMRVHEAKVDRWLAPLLAGVVAAEVATGLAVILGPGLQPTSGGGEWLAGLTMIGVGVIIGLALGACYRIRYEVSRAGLRIKFGPLGTSIPLESVVEVFPTRNPLAAPAPSLDRLRINFQKPNGKRRFALIPPQDREAFVRDLQLAAPHLQECPEGPMRLKAPGV